MNFKLLMKLCSLILSLLLLSLSVAVSVSAQEHLSENPNFENELVRTEHEVTIAGERVSYTATTGYLPLLEEDGEHRANIFFVAYTRNDVDSPENRPVTFTFNGGPGSSSVWLHLGAIGPKRVLMTEKGEATQPPYELSDNEYSWLDKTDLVFIDPVMTGYSRPAEDMDKEEFLGYEEDIESVGDFIRLYTSRYNRWGSPKFLAGESYGTTRAAGLSGYLQDRHGMYINGVMLISSILNFQTARFDSGNDLPYPLFLPTYAATAWYHNQLEPELQNMPLEELLNEVEEFALGEYQYALMQGNQLSSSDYDQVAQTLSRYTGLSEQYVKNANLRILIHRFVKELRRDEQITVGRLDSRMTGMDRDAAGERYEFDPSYNKAIYGPYTGTLNHYISTELNYRNDLPYEILTGRVQPWNYNNVQNQYLDVSETLRNAMQKNPSLNVWVSAAYYDLATPYFAAEYTFNRLNLPDDLRENIRFTYYESGHMMYIHYPSLQQFKTDFDEFMDDVR